MTSRSVISRNNSVPTITELVDTYCVSTQVVQRSLLLQLELCGRIWKGERKQSKKVS